MNVADLVTMKFIGLRSYQPLSSVEFFIHARVKAVGWDVVRVVFCGKFEHDKACIEFTQDDVDRATRDRTKPQVSGQV